MYHDNLSPNGDQSARAEATWFNNDPEADTRIDLHASNLAAARQAISEATKVEQEQQPTCTQEIRRLARELMRFRSEYDTNTFNLHEDEMDQNTSHLTKDQFDLTA